MEGKMARFFKNYHYDEMVNKIIMYGGLPAASIGSLVGAHIATDTGDPSDVKFGRALFGAFCGSALGSVGIAAVAVFHPLVPFLGVSIPVYAYQRFKQSRNMK